MNELMSKSILIVDDSQAIVDLVSEALNSEGYDVSSASNGKEALNQLKEGCVDLIISDIYMPVMDGIEFIQEVRKLNHCQYTPVLILTTEDDYDMKMKGKHAGATGWLVKPIVSEQLLNTVSRVFS